MKKLIIAVVQNEDADGVVDALLEGDFRATRLASTGGFLRRGNTTLMIGADEDQVDHVLGLIRQHARSAGAPADAAATATAPAAATVFVLNLEEYQRL
ncbi:MAG: cyclic-di-AMP receptor [Thermomicrobiales bacterium]